MLARGASPYDVAKLLGDTIETVEKHYAEFVRELRERVRRMMESEEGGWKPSRNRRSVSFLSAPKIQREPKQAMAKAVSQCLATIPGSLNSLDAIAAKRLRVRQGKSRARLRSFPLFFGAVVTAAPLPEEAHLSVR